MPTDPKSSEASKAAAISRRDFTKCLALGAAGLLPAKMPVMAGPFASESEHLKLIPTDKKLDPAWMRSLVQRGKKEVYSDPRAIRHIGMPVGGLFAGTVYLGGDGRLWLWDIFNRDQEGIDPRTVRYKGQDVRTRNGANYLEPAVPKLRFAQGFGIRIGGKTIPINSDGFPRITFRGGYPRASIAYEDEGLPVSVNLEAFSPFIPLNTEDSSLPATIMQYTIKNTGHKTVTVNLVGHLQNAVCLDTGRNGTGLRRNRIVSNEDLLALVCEAIPVGRTESQERPDILYEDFEREVYEQWTVEGESFGKGPILMRDIPDYQGHVRGQGKRVVNSHATAPGANVREKDQKTGALTSKPFKIERKFITFLVGGGAHQGRTCINLLVDGKVVATHTGKNNNQMEPGSLRVEEFEGRLGVLQIVDKESGGWGNVGVDHIVFTDKPVVSMRLQDQRDFGTMALALLGRGNDTALANRVGERRSKVAQASLTDELVGQLGRQLRLKPGDSETVTFAIAWHFPNLYARGCGGQLVGHHYAERFGSALEVAQYLRDNMDRLASETRIWVETWYDSTLPYWFLDRTMANTSVLATTTCYRFKDGRVWAWEGIGCCAGTCTHVWQYAQAPGRLFPNVERIIRERVDFGLSMHADGGIGMRAHLTGSNHPAHDGQCGRILGAYREHQMSRDDAFLRRIWPNVKRAMEYMINADGNGDGMVEGAQANTLDAAWFGKISFLASLYLAALRACEAMATDMDDVDFAKHCKAIADRGADKILETWNGEYFLQIEDPAHKEAIGTGPGCYIDQVYGQSWAHQVALGHLFDPAKQRSALAALYKYNFVPDVGPFRERFSKGRWYATAGDAGLLMCTWPNGGQNPRFKDHWQYMYFNECMTGFEWQAASHMIMEGMLTEGLAIGRAIHDRYNAMLRNPYNEIECSDHYARSMASYGSFIAASGFEYHGPKGHIGFRPRLSPQRYKSAFTSAEGWGQFAQRRDSHSLKADLEVRWGRLRLRTIGLELEEGHQPNRASVRVRSETVPVSMAWDDRRVTLTLDTDIIVAKGERLHLEIS